MFLPSHRAWALDPEKSVFQFTCRSWTRTNGLPADNVGGVAQTQDGYLWVATENGFLRYDGLEFKAVSIDLPEAQGQHIRQLVAAPDGSLRFCLSTGGFGGFDGRNFFPVVPAEQSAWKGLSILASSDGSTWIGSRTGWGRWSPLNPRVQFHPGETNLGIVLSMCEDSAGRVWLGTADRGLFLWQNGRIVEQYSEPAWTIQGVSALAADGTNRLWIGTPAGLHSLADGTITSVPGSYNVSALLVDRNRTLWVGTSAGGLLRWARGRFVAFTRTDGLAGDSVTSLFEDAEGSVWVGTRGGLSQLSDVKFPIVSSREGIVSGSVHSVAADPGGGLWIAAAGGLTRLEGANVTNFAAAALRGNPYIKLCFVARNGDVYAEDGDKNIDVLSGGNLDRCMTNSEWVSAFCEDAEGVIVGRGTSNSLFRIKDGQFVPYEYRGQAPNFYWIHNLLCARDGAIWVACGNGIFRLEAGAVQHWGSADGLSGDTALWLSEDKDGTIWVGLATGIARLKNGQLKNIRPENGLADSWVYAMVPDDYGNFWCSSSHGIFRVSRQALNDFADGKAARVYCKRFDSSDAVKPAGRTDQEVLRMQDERWPNLVSIAVGRGED